MEFPWIGGDNEKYCCAFQRRLESHHHREIQKSPLMRSRECSVSWCSFSSVAVSMHLDHLLLRRAGMTQYVWRLEYSEVASSREAVVMAEDSSFQCFQKSKMKSCRLQHLLQLTLVFVGSGTMCSCCPSDARPWPVLLKICCCYHFQCSESRSRCHHPRLQVSWDLGALGRLVDQSRPWEIRKPWVSRGPEAHPLFRCQPNYAHS